MDGGPGGRVRRGARARAGAGCGGSRPPCSPTTTSASATSPVWLRDVAAHAARHGLRYLGDAEPAELRADRQPPGVDEQLDALAGGDRVVWEQYADLLAGRAFRQTLLCRADAPLDDAIDPARLQRLWFAATDAAGIGEPAGDADGAGARRPGAVQRLHRPGGGGAARARPPALAQLRRAARRARRHRRPRTSPTRCGGRSAPARSSLGRPSAARDGRGERPEASPVARWQAARGPELTNLRHDPVRLDDPLGRALVGLCDGTRDRAALVDGLVAAVGHELALTMDGVPLTDGEAVREQLAAGLEPNLEILARLAMLRA